MRRVKGGVDENMTTLSILATVFGAVGGIANFPQAYKIFKRKSAKDISILTYGFLLIGAIVWILYGVEIKNFPVIITNSLGAINIGLVVIGWSMYGKERRRK
ncbi:MAG: SemiSWEET family transporter [Nanoarchaeota archaeon]